MLNAIEPGTVVPIHRHPTKDESFVILRGKVRVTTHNDEALLDDMTAQAKASPRLRMNYDLRNSSADQS
jgi:uncharacterized cupin superfamily protein